MILSKADFGIAARYAELVPEAHVRDKVFGSLKAEFERTKAAVLAIRRHSSLLEDQPALLSTIKLRFSFLDCLNHLQVSIHAWAACGFCAVQPVAGILMTAGKHQFHATSGCSSLPY